MTSYPVVLQLRRTMNWGPSGELKCQAPLGEGEDLDIHYLHNIFPSLFGPLDENPRMFEITLLIKEVKKK